MRIEINGFADRARSIFPRFGARLDIFFRSAASADGLRGAAEIRIASAGAAVAVNAIPENN